MLTLETKSAHLVPALHPLQPPKHDTASRILIKNCISPSALNHSQLTLFEHADDEQRSRLVELWRIVPPTETRNGGQGLADQSGEHQTTTVRQEEELAWLRYQRDSNGQDTSSFGNYHDQNQYSPEVIDQHSDSIASGFPNMDQEPPNHQNAKIDYRIGVNNDAHDVEML